MVPGHHIWQMNTWSAWLCSIVEEEQHCTLHSLDLALPTTVACSFGYLALSTSAVGGIVSTLCLCTCFHLFPTTATPQVFNFVFGPSSLGEHMLM